MQQYTTLIFIALLALVFYFLILRPQRKRQQAIQQTMNALSPGDRVMLASGLFGTVVSVGAKQVVLETSPGSELTVLKQAISKIVTEADEDSPDEQEGFDELEGVDEPEALDEHNEANVADVPITENAAPEEPLAGGASRRGSSGRGAHAGNRSGVCRRAEIGIDPRLEAFDR